jgi:hypothetical protein
MLPLNYKILDKDLMPIKYPLPKREAILSKLEIIMYFQSLVKNLGFGKLGLVPKIDLRIALYFCMASVNGIHVFWFD